MDTLNNLRKTELSLSLEAFFKKQPKLALKRAQENVVSSVPVVTSSSLKIKTPTVNLKSYDSVSNLAYFGAKVKSMYRTLISFVHNSSTSQRLTVAGMCVISRQELGR